MIQGVLNETTIGQYRARNWRLKRLGYESYQEYLKSKEWERVKKFVFSKIDFQKCHVCASEFGLVLHHKSYTRIRFRSLKKQMAMLVALCFGCHHKVHEYNLSSKTSGLKASVRNIKRKHEKNK